MRRCAPSGKPLVVDFVTPRYATCDEETKSNEERCERKVQVSVARYLRTPPYGANRKGLVLILRAAYAASAIGARLSLATVIMDR